ncbi:SAF domain-containing protein [Actinopolyspora erythraea]|uniref:SAF domain-containing protein n=1 Tax=Actinopolyspora erythraea TaxID=414996 RepID=UPI000A406CCD|nr:SAF domain-containing protein [Actinopolyspora erythraea]
MRQGGANGQRWRRARERAGDVLRIHARRIVLLRRALVVALLLTAGWYALPAVSGTTPSGVAVLTASHDLEPGHRLTTEDVNMVRMPAELAPDGVLRQRERATGGVLARAARRGEPLTDLSLLDEQLAELTSGETNEAAVAIRPADDATAKLLHPGRHVDVVGSRNGRAEVLAERAAVLAVRSRERGSERGPLVVVGLDRHRAAAVAAAALRETVTMTLR